MAIGRLASMMKKNAAMYMMLPMPHDALDPVLSTRCEAGYYRPILYVQEGVGLHPS